jgi:hypothetical protein
LGDEAHKLRKNRQKPLTKQKMCAILLLPLLEEFFCYAHFFERLLLLSKNAKEEKSFVEGGKTLNLPGGVQNESENNTRLQRMQAKKLRLYEKQEKRS